MVPLQPCPALTARRVSRRGQAGMGTSRWGEGVRVRAGPREEECPPRGRPPPAHPEAASIHSEPIRGNPFSPLYMPCPLPVSSLHGGPGTGGLGALCSRERKTGLGTEHQAALRVLPKRRALTPHPNWVREAAIPPCTRANWEFGKAGRTHKARRQVSHSVHPKSLGRGG